MADEQKQSAEALRIEAERKKLQDELNFGKRVMGMSHRQLTKELRKRANERRSGKDFVMNPPKGMPVENTNCAGLDNALAVVLGIVHENTRTARFFDQKANGDPCRPARKDQIGKGTLTHYLR